MKLVRVVSETPSDAADLISFLENHGFVVETGQASDPSQPLADFEIDLRVLPIDDALHLAREMASGEVDVLIGPGVFAEPEQFVEEPVSQVEQFETEPFVEVEPELAAAPVQPEYESADEELTAPRLMAAETGEHRVSEHRVEEADSMLATRRLRESIAQVLAEAGLTARECLALCSAELLNGSESARRWLAQARVLVIRKRALVETRALRARTIVENRLRFDPMSQNAWIRSAFAGAGLMVMLLGLMLWKDHRFTPGGNSSLPDSGAASMLKSAPSGARTAEAGASSPATASLHRRLPSERADLVDDREVIIRHYGQPSAKRAAVIDTKSGVKHISDMN